jgi:hypothetical protein
MIRRLAGCLAVALALAAAAPAVASARFQVGIQDDASFTSRSAFDRVRAFAYADQMGVTWLKLTLGWDGYHTLGFRPYDTAVDEALARGWNVQLMLTGSPWYSSRHSWLPNKDPKPGRFGTFVATVVRHFRGRVKFYSLWDEPNLFLYLGPHSRAHVIFWRLFKAGYRAAKRADPAATVLLGEMAPGRGSLDFLKRVTDQGPLVADGYAHHPYQFTLVPPGQPEKRYLGISNTDVVVRTLAQLAAKHRLNTPDGGRLPLYFTEFGYPRPGAMYGAFSEAQRARFAVAAFRLAKQQGARVLVYYQLYRQRGGARRNLWDTGLLSPGGFEFPIYRALVADRFRLTGTRPKPAPQPPASPPPEQSPPPDQSPPSDQPPQQPPPTCTVPPLC